MSRDWTIANRYFYQAGPLPEDPRPKPSYPALEEANQRAAEIVKEAMSKKKHPNSPPFPPEIFITICPDDAEIYLLDTGTESVDDGEYVAVYQLVQIKRKVVEHGLESLGNALSPKQLLAKLPTRRAKKRKTKK